MKLLFEKSRPGRRAGIVPGPGLPVPELPAELRRAEPPRLPELAEPELVRHFTELTTRNFGIVAHIDAALEYCTEHTQDLWRINVHAVAARWMLDRGRWDDAVRHAGAVIADPRESPWTHHEALCVLALVRARRGDPGAREALSQAAAVGVPQEERFAHVDLAAAGAEIAWLERRPDDVEAATTAMLEGAVEHGDREAAGRLLFWRRLAGLAVEVPDDTIH